MLNIIWIILCSVLIIFLNFEMFFNFLGYGIIVIIVAVLWLFVFRKLNILDRPGHDWIPPRLFKVPNFQGIVLIIWFRTGLLLFAPELLHIQKIAWLLYLATAYGVFNFINDIIDRKGDMTGIPAKYRLIIQILFVCAYVWVSWTYQNISLFGYAAPEWLWFLFSSFRILGFINALNFFDGSHAMTAWVTGIGYIAVALIIQTVVLTIYQVSWENLILMNGIIELCILFAISCFVYLGVEYKPSWVLRDSGISFIGFTLGALSLLWGAKIGTMLLVLFLPICDSIRVFLNRIIVMKKNPMKGDYTHLHHRLMALWLKRSEVRRPIWAFTLTMLVLLLLLWDWSMDKLILFAWFAFLFFGLHIYLYRIKKLPFELIKKEKKQDN